MDLGKKVWKFGFSGGGGVFCNFGFGLREKSWKFGFSGGGVFCKGDGKRKKPTLQKNLPDQFGIIPKSPIPRFIHLNILTLAPYPEPNKICLTFLKSGVKVSTKLC